MTQEDVEIEPRAYGAECSSEERRALLDRVYLLEPNVVMWRELPVLSPFPVALFGQKIAEITAGLTSFSILVDATEVERPNAEVRECLRSQFGAMTGLDHVAMFTGHNGALNLAAKFVLGSSLGTAKFTVHTSQAEALEAIRTKLDPDGQVGIVKYIAEITEGRCSITDELISQEPNRAIQEALSGLQILHEDLALRERQRTLATEQIRVLNQGLEEKIHQRTQDLAYKESLLRSILDNVGAAVFIVDIGPDGGFRYAGWNSVADTITGIRSEDTIGRTPLEIFGPDLGQKLADNYARCVESGDQEYEEYFPSGNTGHWSLTKLTRMTDDAGRVAKIIGFAIDITDRKLSEDALVESRNLLRVIIDAVPVRVFWKDKDLRYLGCNPLFVMDSGKAHIQDVVGRDDYDMSWANEADLYRADDRSVMESGISRLQYEEPQTTPDGKTIWLRTSKVPLRDGNDQIIGVLGIYDDITQQRTAVDATARSEAYLRSLMDNVPYYAWLKDTEGRYLAINKAFSDFLRLGCAEEVFGKTDLDMQPKELAEKYRTDDAEVMASRQQKQVEEQAFDGTTSFWVETSKTPVIDPQGNVLGTAGVARDITDRKMNEINLRIAATAVEASQDGISITDANGVIIKVNRAFSDITGYEPNEVVGTSSRILKSGRHDAAFYAEMWRTLFRTGKWDGEIWDRRKTGEIYPKWLRISAVYSDDGAVTNFVGVHTDISSEKIAEEAIRKLAFYDQLTGLPNRRLLMDRLQQALVAAKRSGRDGALLFIDMDNFKNVNDALGHNIGDLLLQDVAQRLVACIREVDTAARIGGDEFVVMLESLAETSEDAAIQAISVGEKILDALGRGYTLCLNEVRSTPSIGVALFGNGQQDIDDLMKQADIAMYQAKMDGRNALRLFDPELQTAVNARVSLESELRRALTQNEFELYYQPQVQDGRIIGTEALIRWRRPGSGLVSPTEFIPVAEETGLILPMGLWVLETACLQIARWSTQPRTADITVAVNISAKQFRQADFVEQIVGILARTGADPQKLKLELTESLLFDKAEGIIAKMEAIKNLGISFSLDDFGTGFSSLSYLKLLPISQLKIDRSFVRDVLTDPNDAIIIRTIIVLCQSMNLSVIAEGVETKEQLEFLAGHGCTASQGYLFGKPMPVEDFERLLG